MLHDLYNDYFAEGAALGLDANAAADFARRLVASDASRGRRHRERDALIADLSRLVGGLPFVSDREYRTGPPFVAWDLEDGWYTVVMVQAPHDVTVWQCIPVSVEDDGRVWISGDPLGEYYVFGPASTWRHAAQAVEVANDDADREAAARLGL